MTQPATSPSSLSGMRRRTMASQRRAKGTSRDSRARPAAMVIRPGPGSTSRKMPTMTSVKPATDRAPRRTRPRSASASVASWPVSISASMAQSTRSSIGRSASGVADRVPG